MAKKWIRFSGFWRQGNIKLPSRQHPDCWHQHPSASSLKLACSCSYAPSLQICGLTNLHLAFLILTLHPLWLSSSMDFFLKLNDTHVFCGCVGEGCRKRTRVGMFFGTSFKVLARFGKYGTSSFWKGAVSLVTGGIECLAALINECPSIWEASALFLWNELLC